MAIPLTMQKPILFGDGSLEFVGKVRLVRMQSISIVNLLIVVANFNIGKN